VRQVFVFVLTTVIVFALLQWYKDQSEGFQGADQVVTVFAKYTSATTAIQPSSLPAALTGATITGGVKQLTITNIPTTLNKLKLVTVSYISPGKTTYTVVPAAKIDQGAGTTIQLEKDSGLIRLSTGRLGPGDTTPKLPQPVTALGRTLKIRNLEIGNMGGANLNTSVPNNIKIDLTFGP
jgi:hypothetical protein